MAAKIPDGNESGRPEDSPLTVVLAPMRRKHLRSVLRIEQQVSSQPWTTSLFLSELALRSSRAYTVAQVGSMIAGYTGLMFVGDDAHVSTIATDPLWNRRQIATRLMLHNARIALQRGSANMTLEVSTSNEAAQALYRKFGFAPAGVRKNYYAEVGEDALVMWANDIDSEAYAMRLSAIEAAVNGATVAEVL